MRRISLLVVIGMIVVAALTPGHAADDFVVAENSFTFGQAPDWMPDGQVVHQRPDADGVNQIAIANLDGSGEVCLTCGQPGPNMVPDSRPQGDVVLFHSWRGTNIKLGAPGFGGLGSDLYVVDVATHETTALTTDHDGYDNYHAYFSPDGSRIVWTRLNWNFVTDTGRGYWDIRVADYIPMPTPHLANIHVVHEGPGHYFETQHWAPDGSGFLFTESVETTLNLELFSCRLEGVPDRCAVTRLTNNPAWDEQAIYTPDGTKVIFMSTRDHESAWNTWASAFWTAGTPSTLDYLLILPLFELGFLQPVAAASNDLYELDLTTGAVRRLTHEGEDGWIIPEFVWSPDGTQLLWTESKYTDGVRAQLPPDPVRDVTELVAMLQDPPHPSVDDLTGVGLTVGFLLEHRTLIGIYQT